MMVWWWHSDGINGIYCYNYAAGMINSTKSGSPWWYNGGLRGKIWMTYFEVVKRQHFFLCFGGKNCNDFDPLSMVSEVWFRWLRWSSPRSKCSSEAWSRRVDLCRWILGNGWNEWWLVGYSFFFEIWPIHLSGLTWFGHEGMANHQTDE